MARARGRSGDRVIARDRVIGKALPRINADDRGSAKAKPFRRRFTLIAADQEKSKNLHRRGAEKSGEEILIADSH